ncbi:MAG: coproporphyrinogen III oxidase, partial [Opitutales bacterium]
MRPEPADPEAIRAYFLDLQDRICNGAKELDPTPDFREDDWERPKGGGGRTRAIADGKVFEKGGVNFSDVHGANLPPSATAQRPELAGAAFRAMGVSVVLHPDNPFAPTSHANVRF